MKLFLSCDAQVSAVVIIGGIIKEIDKRIGEIEIADYTNALDSIGIIIKCFDDEWMKSGHGKERKYISWKNRYADIRLLIPYDKLIQADRTAQFGIVKDCIFEAVMTIDQKVNAKAPLYFDGKEMIEEIERRLIENQLPRFPNMGVQE